MKSFSLYCISLSLLITTCLAISAHGLNSAFITLISLASILSKPTGSICSCRSFQDTFQHPNVTLNGQRAPNFVPTDYAYFLSMWQPGATGEPRRRASSAKLPRGLSMLACEPSVRREPGFALSSFIQGTNATGTDSRCVFHPVSSVIRLLNLTASDPGALTSWLDRPHAQGGVQWSSDGPGSRWFLLRFRSRLRSN